MGGKPAFSFQDATHFNWISSARELVNQVKSNFGCLLEESLQTDRAYFSLRASEEILAAEKAAHPVARAAHYHLAEHYLGLVSSIEAQSRRTLRALLEHSHGQV